MDRLFWTFALVLLPTMVAAWLMWVGYRRQRNRDITALTPPEDREAPATEPDASLLYTGTTRGGSWLKRVALPGLYANSKCDFWLTSEGPTFQLSGGPVVLAAPVVEVSLEKGHAGRAVGSPRVLVVRWAHPTTSGEVIELDSGFVCDSVEQAESLHERIASYVLGGVG